jgi:hypothetical protein
MQHYVKCQELPSRVVDDYLNRPIDWLKESSGNFKSRLNRISVLARISKGQGATYFTHKGQKYLKELVTKVVSFQFNCKNNPKILCSMHFHSVWMEIIVI